MMEYNRMRRITHSQIISIIILYYLMHLIIADNSTEESVESVQNNNPRKKTNNYDDVNPKITGGYRDSKSKFAKYTASLRLVRLEAEHFGAGHFCTGTIISSQIVLTASHCFMVTSDMRNIQVVVGTIYRLQYNKWAQIIRIDRVIMHPYYDQVTHFNDIALIKLRHKILIDNKHTGIIALPRAPPESDTECTAAGWGRMFFEGPSPDEIVYVDLKILSKTECDYRNFIKSPNEICAKDLNDLQKDTCQGDSGGPLYSQNGTVIGITSRGPPCGDLDPSQTGIYTNVYDYVNWITRNSADKQLIVCLYDIFFSHAIWFEAYILFFA